MVHAELRGPLARLLGQVARPYALVALAPGGAAVVGVPYARGRNAHGQLVRVARPGDDRVQAEPAAARLPVAADAVLAQCLVEVPRLAPIARLEQHAGVPARVQLAGGLALRDQPDPLERLVPALRKRDARCLRPLAGGVVGVEDLRPV